MEYGWRLLVLQVMIAAALAAAPARPSAGPVVRNLPLQLRAPTLQFILEYIRWRDLKQVVIYDYFTRKGEVSEGMLRLMRCLSHQGVYSTVHSAINVTRRSLMQVHHHNLGVVLLLPDAYDLPDVFRLSAKEMYFGEYYLWLVLAPNPNDAIVEEFLSNQPLRLNTNMVTVPSLNPEPTPERRVAENRKFYKNVSLEYANFYLLQVYKIRSDLNNSVVVLPLGFWGSYTGFTKCKKPKMTEERGDLRGFPLVVGVRNWIKNPDVDDSLDRKLASNMVNLDKDYLREILYYITDSINASVKFVSFTNLGTQNQDGSWSNLLGAVVAGTVDIGVEKVEISHEKLAQMSFTYTIIKSKRNIFMHQSELSTSRDIFLTSFSPRLLLSVLATCSLSVIFMIFINNLWYRLLKGSGHPECPEDRVQVTEAAVWNIGMMTMQGTIWIPKSTSGMILTVTSLLFAVVIYNSYAGFITSVLSIKQGNIRTLDDIYNNGYDIGYVTGSSDEEYLQVQTNELTKAYVKGHAFRVDTIEEGLLRAAREKYALFTLASRARQVLNVLSPQEYRCLVEEFNLPMTVEKNAFPMPKRSPYRKIINLYVLKVKEMGPLNKMQQLMYPQMPRCSQTSPFISAQLSDVLTAFKLFGVGLAACLLVAAAEFCWNQRARPRPSRPKH